MNAKQLKYLTLFEEMSKADPSQEATVKKYLPSLLSLDYALALEAWEYICTTREQQCIKDEKAASVLGGYSLGIFCDKALPKTVKALSDCPAIRRTVYQYSSSVNDGYAFSILVDALLGNKTDYADEIFKCLVRNERIEYGPLMKKLLERLFIEILKKSASKKIEMSRKLSALLLTYVSKIKTDERAMLEQRIRENM